MQCHSHLPSLDTPPCSTQVTKEEYATLGSAKLGAHLVEQLRAAGANPYLVPVGGSSALGTWGYLQVCSEKGLVRVDRLQPRSAVARGAGMGSWGCILHVRACHTRAATVESGGSAQCDGA